MPNPDPDPDPSQLNWTLIPEELATANLSRVGPSTVAFHAVGVAASSSSASCQRQRWQLVWLGAPSRSQARTWVL